MILLIATTFLVNTIVARSSEVYPVHRQDFVSNGQPTSLPYQSPRQDGVYRVSRQDFGSPRQQIQYPYRIDSRNDQGAIPYWYPGFVSYDYQNNYPNTISAPVVLRDFPVIPNLFVPAPNQVFKVNVDNAIPTGQPSTSRPRSSSTKSPFDDDSVLPPISKSSVDEGEPLSALSDYSKKTPGRSIKYVPVNDDVEINEEQKDLLRSYHSSPAIKVSAEKKERSKFPPRIRRSAPYNSDERFSQGHDGHRFFRRVKKYPQVPKNMVTTEPSDEFEPQLYFGLEKDDDAVLSNLPHSRVAFPKDLFWNNKIIPTSAPEVMFEGRESIEDESSVVAEPRSRIAFPDAVDVSGIIHSRIPFPRELFWDDKIIPAVDEKTNAPERKSIEDENSDVPDDDDSICPVVDEKTTAPKVVESTQDESSVVPGDVPAEPSSRIAFPDLSDVIHSRIAFPKELFWDDKIIPAVDEKTSAPEPTSQQWKSIEDENSVVPVDVLVEPKALLSNDEIIPAVDEKATAPKVMFKELKSIEGDDSLAPGDTSAVMAMIFDVLRYSASSSNEVDNDYGREMETSDSVEIIQNRGALNSHRLRSTEGVKSPATASKDYENLTLKDLLSVISHAIVSATDLTDEELELLELIRRHMLDENDSLNTELSELDERVKSLLSRSAEKFNSIEENLRRQANTLKKEEKGGVLSYKPSLSFTDELKMMKSALLSEMTEDENRSSNDIDEGPSSMVFEREPEVSLYVQKK